MVANEPNHTCCKWGTSCWPLWPSIGRLSLPNEWAPSASPLDSGRMEWACPPRPIVTLPPSWSWGVPEYSQRQRAAALNWGLCAWLWHSPAAKMECIYNIYNNISVHIHTRKEHKALNVETFKLCCSCRHEMLMVLFLTTSLGNKLILLATSLGVKLNLPVRWVLLSNEVVRKRTFITSCLISSTWTGADGGGGMGMGRKGGREMGGEGGREEGWGEREGGKSGRYVRTASHHDNSFTILWHLYTSFSDQSQD